MKMRYGVNLSSVEATTMEEAWKLLAEMLAKTAPFVEEYEHPDGTWREYLPVSEGYEVVMVTLDDAFDESIGHDSIEAVGYFAVKIDSTEYSALRETIGKIDLSKPLEGQVPKDQGILFWQPGGWWGLW